MKIAILSDSHDNVPNLQKAIEQINALGAETLLFCGDFCSPFMVAEIAAFKGDAHVVFGNNDGDRFRIAVKAQKVPNVTLHGEYAALVLDGKRIGMTHYPFYATAMAKSGDFDLVAFGHDHDARIMMFGEAMAVNPGAVLFSKNGNPPGFAIYDTAKHEAVLQSL